MLDGWRKIDPPTTKKLPVESDVPELLSDIGRAEDASELVKCTGDSALVAFYYLLRVGEYTVKSARTQTVPFKMEDVRFFKENHVGQLIELPYKASALDILSADGASLKLDNQKNGWKGVCVFQWANGEKYNCPVRALARRFLHIRTNGGRPKTNLSAYWVEGKQYHLTADNMSKALKFAATALAYPTLKGIPIDRVDTHSLRMGGANALALAGYSDTQIQKMGRWRGATFKEYIREELACFSSGMSKDMKHRFNFVNVSGNAFRDVTSDVMTTAYNTAAAA